MPYIHNWLWMCSKSRLMNCSERHEWLEMQQSAVNWLLSLPPAACHSIATHRGTTHRRASGAVAMATML